MPDFEEFKGFVWLEDNQESPTTENQPTKDDFGFNLIEDKVEETVDSVVETPEVLVEDTGTEAEATEEDTETEPISEEEESAIEVIINAAAEKNLLWFDPEKEYSEGDDMLFEVIEDTVAKRIEEKRSKISPDKLEIIKHLEEGGDLDILRQVENAFDYSLIDLDDADTRKQLVTDYLKTQDYSDQEIVEELETLEDLGEEKLLKKAKQAQKFFIKQTEEEKTRLLEEDKKRVASEKKALENQAKELEKTILSTRKIKGFEISEKEAEELRDYILRADKKTGKTQAQLDAENTENALAMYYFMKKKFEHSDVEKKVKTQITSNLNKKLSQFTSKSTTSSGKTVKPDAPDELKIPSWF